jgi:drug/metabolite transporter (DMT)-like permease
LTPFLIFVIAVRAGGDAVGAIRRAGWAGVVGGISLVFAFGGGIYGIQNSTVANAMFLFAAAPFFAAILGKLLLKESVRLGTKWAMLAATAGIAVMVSEGISMGHLAGNVAALVSALGFAVFTVALRWRQVEETMPTVFLAGVFAMGTAAVVLQSTGAGFIVPLNDILVSLSLGIVQVGAGLILYSLGSKAVPAVELTLLSMTEVVLGPIWTWLLMGETAGVYTLIGGGVLLSAIAANALTGLRRKPTPIF